MFQDWQQQIPEIVTAASWAGELTGLPFPVHPHMLRHGAGYYLASKRHDTRAFQVYLGHCNIQHTVRYTELAPGQSNDLWKDQGTNFWNLIQLMLIFLRTFQGQTKEKFYNEQFVLKARGL